MPLMLRAPPAIEPVSLAEAKSHIRADGPDEDILVQSLITTSRLQIEAALGLALISQDWTLVVDRWPSNMPIDIPINPIAVITEIRVRASDGSTSVVDPSTVAIDLASRPPRIARRAATSLCPGVPLAGIEIDITAGFGPAASDVPQSIRHALLLLVAHWHEYRLPPEIGAQLPPLPEAVSQLLSPYRIPHL